MPPSSHRSVAAVAALLGALAGAPSAQAQAGAAPPEARLLAPGPHWLEGVGSVKRPHDGLTVEQRQEAVLKDRAAGALRPAGEAADDHVVRRRAVGSGAIGKAREAAAPLHGTRASSS